jgi:pyrroloquinoline quinone biosynthesis protein D
MTATTIEKPRLATGVRLAFDKVRDRHILLYPEGVVTLNETAVAVLELCDGERTIGDIAAQLGSQFQENPDLRADVEQLIGAIAARGLVIDAAR